MPRRFPSMPGDRMRGDEHRLETEDVCPEHQEVLFAVRVTEHCSVSQRGGRSLHPWRYPKQGAGQSALTLLERGLWTP